MSNTSGQGDRAIATVATPSRLLRSASWRRRPPNAIPKVGSPSARLWTVVSRERWPLPVSARRRPVRLQGRGRRCEVCKNASVRERKATRTTTPSRCRCEDSRGKLACTPKSGVKPVGELFLCERSAPVKLPLLTRGNQVRARKRATKVLWFAIRHLMAYDRTACWFRQLPPRS